MRLHVNPTRGGDREIRWGRESETDMLSRMRTNLNSVWVNDHVCGPINPSRKLLDRKGPRLQRTNQVLHRHVHTRETGVGPVKIAANRSFSWISRSSSKSLWGIC